MKLEIVQAKRNLLPVSFRRNLQTSDKLYHLAPLTWLHWMVPSFLQRCLKRLRSAILLTKLFSNDAIKLSHEYRDRIYIRKDIVLKLTEYGELNQTTLLSYTGLNLAKHKEILEDMEKKGIIKRREEPWGYKKIVKYSVTEEGKDFCIRILEPYEQMFPRKEK